MKSSCSLLHFLTNGCLPEFYQISGERSAVQQGNMFVQQVCWFSPLHLPHFFSILHYIHDTYSPLYLHHFLLHFLSDTFSSILVLMGHTCIAWEGSIETQTKAFKKKQSLVLVLVISENEANLIQFEFVLLPLTLTSLIEVASPFNSIH